MLTSLFGDLGPRDGKTKSRDFDDTQADSQGGFAATAIMESVATEVNERGQIIDRHVSDLVVTGSPAQAIREHFAATRADLDTATVDDHPARPGRRLGVVGGQGAVRCRRPADRAAAPARADDPAHDRDDRAHDARSPPRRHAAHLPRRRARARAARTPRSRSR